MPRGFPKAGFRRIKPAIVRFVCPRCGLTVTNLNPGAHKLNCEMPELARERMKLRNPMRDPAAVATMSATLRAKLAAETWVPFGGKRGGNGKTSPSEAKAAELLAHLGFHLHFVVLTGGRTHDRPAHYKLNLANPEKMIAIEIDG